MIQVFNKNGELKVTSTTSGGGGGGGSVIWGAITGDILDQSDLVTYVTGLPVSTFANDAGYLTTFSETDPIFSASPAFGIGSTNIAHWNTAFGWGNHALAGYLTSYTETDPVWLSDKPSYLTSAIAASTYAALSHTHTFASLTSKPTTISGYGITDAYPLTGNPSGFLTSFSETDPVWLADKPNYLTTAAAASTYSVLSHTHTFASLTSKPTTISGYGITDLNSLGDARWSLLGHTHAFSTITGTPTTIVGYGITDFNSLGDARWSLLAHTHTFASLTSKPTTVSGYGITDAVSTSVANTYTVGAKQSFQGDSVNAAIRIGGVTANPSSPQGGDIWFRTDEGVVHYYDAIAGTPRSFVNLSTAQTLTNKTLTSPVLNTGVSGTAIDNDVAMAADSATLIPTQHAAKTYGDNTFTTKSLAAYSVRVNNTNATANVSTVTFRDVAEQTLTSGGSFTFTGTAPSGAETHRYTWSQIGKMVTLIITCVWITPGTAVTVVTIPMTLMSDLPTPAIPTGLTAAGDNLYFGSGRIVQTTSQISSGSNTGWSEIRRNVAGTGFEIAIGGTGVSIRGAMATITYRAV